MTETDDVSDDGDDVRTTSLRNGAKRLERFPGCTAIAALRCWATRAYVANAGDCRAVVCVDYAGDARRFALTTGHAADTLSADHVADTSRRSGRASLRPPVRTRYASWTACVGSGHAGLAVTRASATRLQRGRRDRDCPEVTAYAVDASDEDTHTSGKDFALVLACDGLWDVVSNADARDLVLDTVKEPNDERQAARGARR